MAFVVTNSGHLITSATTLIVGAITTSITTYIVTSHTTIALISSDRKFEAIDKKIADLDTRVTNVENDVKMQNTESRVLEKISYGLIRASTREKTHLEGLMKAYENWNSCRETGSGC